MTDNPNLTPETLRGETLAANNMRLGGWEDADQRRYLQSMRAYAEAWQAQLAADRKRLDAVGLVCDEAGIPRESDDVSTGERVHGPIAIEKRVALLLGSLRALQARVEALRSWLDESAFRGYALDGFCKWVCQSCKGELITLDDEAPEATGHKDGCLVASALAGQEERP